jgi:phosphatidylglycerol:prolipoprotein diacylglycerol transferase
MTIDIGPVIGKLGPLEFRWYGIIMAVAVVLGVWIMSRELKRRGISPEHALGIAVFGVPCGIIGARLVHVFDHLGYYLDNPGKIFGFRLVGLAIYGVVAGGLIGLLVYCRWKKLPVLRVIDSTALAFPAAQIIGKCANIINGDTWGHATDLPWGITYTNPNSFIPEDLLGVATHPTPIYEQLWLLVVVGVLAFSMRRLMKVDGLAVLAYFWLYSLGRFFISFYRENDPMLWGLVEAQVIALAVIVLAPSIAYWLIRRPRKRSPQKPGQLKAAARKDAVEKSATQKPKADKGKAQTTARHKGESQKAIPNKTALRQAASHKAGQQKAKPT